MSTPNVQAALIDPSKLRELLKQIGARPIESGGNKMAAVVGLAGSDEAVILVSRRGNGRTLHGKVVRELRQAKLLDLLPANHLYFGYAFTSKDDPKTLQIDLNKRPSGETKLVHSLTHHLRLMGFSDVNVTVRAELEAENDNA